MSKFKMANQNLNYIKENNNNNWISPRIKARLPL